MDILEKLVNKILDLEEKKKLGLNTRQKFSREMVESLTESGLKHSEIKEYIKNILLKHFHKIHRKYDLIRMREMGIKYVIIKDCGDEKDCKAIKKFRKKWKIEEVPTLPLPKCDAAFCRCYYTADMDSL